MKYRHKTESYIMADLAHHLLGDDWQETFFDSERGCTTELSVAEEYEYVYQCIKDCVFANLGMVADWATRCEKELTIYYKSETEKTFVTFQPDETNETHLGIFISTVFIFTPKKICEKRYIGRSSLYLLECKDGIAMPRVTKVKALPLYVLKLQFNTGETKFYNCDELFCMSGYAPLRDIGIFNSVYCEDGVVKWCDGKIDISPEQLYFYGWEEKK